jgi:hypothetical protein
MNESPITAALARAYGGHAYIPGGNPARCPLCRTHTGTQAMAGTDKRLCADCTKDRPLELIVAEVPA